MQKSAEKKLLIAGIDPGTNKGYAFLDIEGNVVFSNSGKNIELDEIISEAIKYGKPIIVGCDKNPAPDFAARFAAKTGARLIYPEQDLLVKEKEELVKEFEEKFVKEHERDAVASAVFAFRKVMPLLNKINESLKKQGKEDIRNKIIEMVLKKRISIKTAIKILEEPEEKDNEVINKIIEDKKLTEDDFFCLIERIKILENDLKLLKIQNNNLKNEIISIKNEKKILLKKPKDFNKKIDENNYFKEKIINKLNKDLSEKEKIISDKNNKIESLNKIILDLNNKIILKKLDNLGFNELENKNKILDIGEGDILFVKNIDSFSDKTIDFLRNKVQFIIFEKGNNKKLPFNIINAKNIRIKEDEFFAIADKEDFEKEIKKVDMINKVLKEYREEREKWNSI